MAQPSRIPMAAFAAALMLTTLGIVTAGEGNRSGEQLLRQPEALPFLPDQHAVPCRLPDEQSQRGPSQPDGTFVDLTRGEAERGVPLTTGQPAPPRRLPTLAPPRPGADQPAGHLSPADAETLEPNVAKSPSLPPRPASAPQRIVVIEESFAPAPASAAATAPVQRIARSFDPFASHTAAASYTPPLEIDAPSTAFAPRALPPVAPVPFEMVPVGSIVEDEAAHGTVSQHATAGYCPTPCYRPGPLGCVQEHWHTRIKPWLERTHWGYPEEFIQPPLGFYVAAHAKTQIARGQQSLLTLYHFDFEQVGDRAALTPRGRLQLEKFAAVLAYRPFSLLIERTVGEPELDQARYEHVVEALTQLEVPLAAERVVVGRPMSRGMFGPEARMHAERSLEPPPAAPTGGGFGVALPIVGAGADAGTQ